MAGFTRPIVTIGTHEKVTLLAKKYGVKKWKIYEKAITFFDSSGIDG